MWQDAPTAKPLPTSQVNASFIEHTPLLVLLVVVVVVSLVLFMVCVTFTVVPFPSAKQRLIVLPAFLLPPSLAQQLNIELCEQLSQQHDVELSLEYTTQRGFFFVTNSKADLPSVFQQVGKLVHAGVGGCYQDICKSPGSCRMLVIF